MPGPQPLRTIEWGATAPTTRNRPEFAGPIARRRSATTGSPAPGSAASSSRRSARPSNSGATWGNSASTPARSQASPTLSRGVLRVEETASRLVDDVQRRGWIDHRGQALEDPAEVHLERNHPGDGAARRADGAGGEEGGAAMRLVLVVRAEPASWGVAWCSSSWSSDGGPACSWAAVTPRLLPWEPGGRTGRSVRPGGGWPSSK